MSALGLYAVDPVSATYVLTAPLFDRASIQLGGGRRLLVEAHRQSPDDQYIQSVTVDGRVLDRLWIHHDNLIRGAHLIFTLGPEPNHTLGSAESAMPPSLTT
jgi:putative alpha-1,2-mannosidase